MLQVNRWNCLFQYALLMVCLSPWAGGSLGAQSPLDIGVHFSPQLRYISSASVTEEPVSGTFTRGQDGLSMGATGGMYLEVELSPYWSLRGGLDFTYKRNQYRVDKVAIEADTIISGHNQIVYTSIELPLAVVYRFDYLPNGNNFLLGAGTTLTRQFSNPQAYTKFASRSGAKDKIEYPAYTFTVFGGYEHYFPSYLVLGLEPYLTYAPTRFALETTTTARVQVEAGLSLRLRLDN